MARRGFVPADLVGCSFRHSQVQEQGEAVRRVVEFGPVRYRAAGGEEPGGIGGRVGSAGIAADAEYAIALGRAVAGGAELVATTSAGHGQDHEPTSVAVRSITDSSIGSCVRLGCAG